jgi:hypothetical protein
MNLVAILLVGTIILSPHGPAFMIEDRYETQSLDECWEIATRITLEKNTQQTAVCVPAIKEKEKKTEASNK